MQGCNAAYEAWSGGEGGGRQDYDGEDKSASHVTASTSRTKQALRRQRNAVPYNKQAGFSSWGGQNFRESDRYLVWYARHIYRPL